MTEITKTEAIQVKRATVPAGSAALILDDVGRVVALSEAKGRDASVSCPAGGRLFLGTAEELRVKVAAEGLKSLSDLAADAREAYRQQRLTEMQNR